MEFTFLNFARDESEGGVLAKSIGSDDLSEVPPYVGPREGIQKSRRDCNSEGASQQIAGCEKSRYVSTTVDCE